MKKTYNPPKDNSKFEKAKKIVKDSWEKAQSRKGSKTNKETKKDN